MTSYCNQFKAEAMHLDKSKSFLKSTHPFRKRPPHQSIADNMKRHHKNGCEEIDDTEINDKYVERAPELFVCEKRRNSKPIAEATENDGEYSNDDAEPSETLQIVL